MQTEMLLIAAEEMLHVAQALEGKVDGRKSLGLGYNGMDMLKVVKELKEKYSGTSRPGHREHMARELDVYLGLREIFGKD